MFVLQGPNGPMTKKELVIETLEFYPGYSATRILKVLTDSWPDFQFSLGYVYSVMNSLAKQETLGQLLTKLELEVPAII